MVVSFSKSRLASKAVAYLKRTTMNDPGSLRRLRTLPNCPLPHLIRARRKETPQIQHLPHRGDDFRQRALRPQVFALFCGFSLAFKSCEAFFESYAEGEDGVAGRVGFDPLGDFGEVLVFLADVVFFAQVDEVDDWFCREEEEGVYYFDLVVKYCISFLAPRSIRIDGYGEHWWS